MIAAAALGALAAYLAGRLALMRHDLREIGREFRERVHKNTNTLISTGSWDRTVRSLVDGINEDLAVYRKKRHLYESSDQRMREDIANLAHDLRTPLTTVVGYLDLMEEHPERCSEYMRILRGRTDLMTQVISELFEYSMSQSGRPLQTQAADLRAVTENCVIALWTLFTEHHVKPVVRMPGEPVVCTLDTTSAQRLITNIVSNAIRHGAGDVSVTVLDSGVLRISNQTRGIEVLTVEKLFDRYFTVDSGEHTTGLGLGIARTLAEEMGGTMTANLDRGILTVSVQFRLEDKTV